jgi:hypothetical protein
MSFHLTQLRFAGLVTSRRESRSTIYTANFKRMNELLSYLTDNCCGGRPKLCAPNFVPLDDAARSATRSAKVRRR